MATTCRRRKVVGFSKRTGKATITLPSDRSFRQGISTMNEINITR